MVNPTYIHLWSLCNFDIADLYAAPLLNGPTEVVLYCLEQTSAQAEHCNYQAEEYRFLFFASSIGLPPFWPRPFGSPLNAMEDKFGV